MGLDYKDLYSYSVNRIKEKININYADEGKDAKQQEFNKGLIYGLFLCLDMMRTDVIVWDDEKALKDVGLNFDPLEKYDSGTMFDDVDDE